MTPQGLLVSGFVGAVCGRPLGCALVRAPVVCVCVGCAPARRWSASPCQHSLLTHARAPSPSPPAPPLPPPYQQPSDPEELKSLQTKELNNGRLAMIAIAGFVLQELVPPHRESERCVSGCCVGGVLGCRGW